MKQPFKDIEFDGATYRVGRLSARTGDWLVGQALTKLMPGNIEAALMAELKMPMHLAVSRKEISRQDFHELQDVCLSAVSWYEGTVAVPLLNERGAFSKPELEYDAVAVAALTLHSLIFNLAPFFREGVLEKLQTSLSAVLEAEFPGLALPDSSLTSAPR